MLISMMDGRQCMSLKAIAATEALLLDWMGKGSSSYMAPSTVIT